VVPCVILRFVRLPEPIRGVGEQNKGRADPPCRTTEINHLCGLGGGASHGLSGKVQVRGMLPHTPWGPHSGEYVMLTCDFP